MLGKNETKLLRSLQRKKNRYQEGLFIAEGEKLVTELLSSSFELYKLYSVHPVGGMPKEGSFRISEAEMKKISALVTPSPVLGVFRIPKEEALRCDGLILALDGVQDPGNLGTIIRLCDWFGVRQLWCSKSTADCYNPKVVQASMGSLSRVSVHYVDLDVQLSGLSIPVYSTAMEGDVLYTTSFPEQAVIVMGSEGQGVSEEVRKKATRTISIPRFGDTQRTESLNVATATAIVLNEFRRGSFIQR